MAILHGLRPCRPWRRRASSGVMLACPSNPHLNAIGGVWRLAVKGRPMTVSVAAEVATARKESRIFSICRRARARRRRPGRQPWRREAARQLARANLSSAPTPMRRNGAARRPGVLSGALPASPSAPCERRPYRRRRRPSSHRRVLTPGAPLAANVARGTWRLAPPSRCANSRPFAWLGIGHSGRHSTLDVLMTVPLVPGAK